MVDGSPRSDSDSCGDNSLTEATDSMCVLANDTRVGIRCCGDGGGGDAFCGHPWPSTGGESCTTHDYAAALSTCDKYGYRLCTQEEVLAGEVASTGCSYDSMKVWTSTTCVPGKDRLRFYILDDGKDEAGGRLRSDSKNAYNVRGLT